MSVRLPRLAAAGLLLLAIVIAVGAAVLALTLPASVPAGVRQPQQVMLLTVVVAAATVGAFLASRLPSNPIGWMLCAAGCVFGSAGLLYFAVLHAVYGGPEPAVVLALAASVGNLAWPLGIALIAFYIPLFFPDGQLPGRRWRALPWVVAAAILVSAAASATDPNGLDVPGRHVPNPIAIDGAHRVLRMLDRAAGLLLVAGLVAGAVSVFVRYRRGGDQVRHQLKWFVAAVVFMVASLGLSFFTSSTVSGFLMALSMSLLPVAIAFAVLRYRLYDIDVVINKTLVYVSLAAFITILYVGIVAGVGYLIGSQGRPNLLLSILATAVVALLFQPARRRLQSVANQIVYGRQATPYDVLSDFSNVAGSYSEADILPRAAEVLAQGTTASAATVWMRRDSEFVPVAAYPRTTKLPPPIALNGSELDVGASLAPDRAAEIRYHGEVLGLLAVRKPKDEPLTGMEEQLLADLAVQAGPVLHNLALRDELAARLEDVTRQEQELRDSRQRIVTTQDGERRRLERNIHDGAQQHLVALAVKLRLARTLADKAPERARELVRQLESETQQAQQTLRELARGIYPPLLREHGLEAALRAEARTMQLRANFDVKGIGRYADDVEGAVYFCSLEAMQNAAKHAPGAQIHVDLGESGGRLNFSVMDDGPGFDPAKPRQEGSGLRNMRDRIETLGGHVEIDSTPGAGTSVRGSIAARRAVAA